MATTESVAKGAWKKLKSKKSFTESTGTRPRANPRYGRRSEKKTIPEAKHIIATGNQATTGG